MGTWVVDTSNQLCIKNVQKVTVVIGKIKFFGIGLFCTHHYLF